MLDSVMVIPVLPAVLLLALLLPVPQDAAFPERGPLTISGDTRIPRGRYLRPAIGTGGHGGVIVATGLHDVTIDLEGVEFRGAAEDIGLDELAGWGIVLQDCKNVTIRGGRIGGYRGCIVAERCDGLTIDGVTFDSWFGQRLLSTSAGENPADWLWPHDNDEGEWLAKYGAAISLSDCTNTTIRSCRGRHGQNGILLNRCEDAQIYDCDFSFLSGWGLAMYRSNRNVIARNVFDYCVRGYSHGVYWRGQDSAGILMFERCSDNVIALNSATHGGDGLFLFAGQDSVEGHAYERGETDVEGCDRNLFYGNDFSYAVANAIEATFSRDNVALRNLGRGCHQHGVWGGYSSRMVIVDNDFSDTIGGGITIEHGQECVIAGNLLEDCTMGVELYWDEDPALVDGPFGERHDTDSRDHWIIANRFARNGADLVVEHTTGLVIEGNRHDPNLDGQLHIEDVQLDGDGDGVIAALSSADGSTPSGRLKHATVRSPAGPAPDSLREARELQLPDLPGAQTAFDREDDGQGLETIVMGEWGPWDFRSGEPRPELPKPGGLLAGVKWDAVWFQWHDGPDPRHELEAWRALAADPALRSTVPYWSGPWGGGQPSDERARRVEVGDQRFGLVAQTEVDLPAGHYELEVTSDDGVRVLIDGTSVLENWTWHAPTTDRALLELSAGEHTFELEYFQIDGAAALTVTLRAAQG
ncbi:MAG: hypothetical protein ACI8QZ_004164 [Chlamydiales bacterium]|jgi:nitrous oxidase accessory protein NosD